MSRRYKIDRGDWVARRDAQDEWRLVGKVVDADDQSIAVESATGVRSVYVVGEDRVARVRWITVRGRRGWQPC